VAEILGLGDDAQSGGLTPKVGAGTENITSFAGLV